MAWLEQRIQSGMRDGSLSRAEGRRAQQTLNQIGRQERGMRHYRNGQLGRNDTAIIQAKLEQVAKGIRADRRDNNDRARGY